MGMIQHNAIIATTSDPKQITKMLSWIKKNVPIQWKNLFKRSKSPINGYQTITMTPDGSKEGWDSSDACDLVRKAFIERIKKDAYDDGSNSWSFIHVGFGEFGPQMLESYPAESRY